MSNGQAVTSITFGVDDDSPFASLPYVDRVGSVLQIVVDMIGTLDNCSLGASRGRQIALAARYMRQIVVPSIESGTASSVIEALAGSRSCRSCSNWTASIKQGENRAEGLTDDTEANSHRSIIRTTQTSRYESSHAGVVETGHLLEQRGR